MQMIVMNINCKWMCFVLGINMQKGKSVQVVRKNEYGANILMVVKSIFGCVYNAYKF